MKPYEKYVTSGLEWIGQIPDGWKVKKLKYLFSVFNGATPKSDNDDFWNGEIVWVTPADYSTEDKFIVKSDRTITDEGLNSCATRIAPVGSIVVSNRAPIGTVAIAATPLTTNQGCKSLVKKVALDERFTYYFLSTQSRNLNALGKGTTFLELSNSDLSCFFMPYPNLDTQNAIADYLDIETAKIDSIIKAKKTLIKRLKEKRTALITHAVTKGLDSSAKMKPSGIDWIRDIPEGWGVKKLKYISLVNRSTLGEDTSPDYEFKYVDIGSVTLEDGITDYTELTFDNAPSRARRLVKQGDTIVSTVRTYLKAIAKIDDAKDIVVSTGFAVIEPKLIDEDFFSYALKSEFFVNMVSANSVGVSYPAINATDIMQIAIAYPKDKEMQKNIASFLKKEIDQMNLSISRTTLSIEKLKEYRTALIYACVTGKLDVRSV